MVVDAEAPSTRVTKDSKYARLDGAPAALPAPAPAHLAAEDGDCLVYVSCTRFAQPVTLPESSRCYSWPCGTLGACKVLITSMTILD